MFLVFTLFFSTHSSVLYPPYFCPQHPPPQTLSLNISRARATESLLASTRAASFSGHLPSRLRKYPQEGALSSLTASSNQAKALLASLSASSLPAEALLLSSTLRQHRFLKEQTSTLQAFLFPSPTAAPLPLRLRLLPLPRPHLLPLSPHWVCPRWPWNPPSPAAWSGTRLNLRRQLQTIVIKEDVAGNDPYIGCGQCK